MDVMNTGEIAMSRGILRTTVAGAIVLGLAFAAPMMADTPSPLALTGKVTSLAEGAMEGVLVGAKKAGSNIATWVVSNAQGQYSFPRARLQPGKYALSVRAAGYELGQELGHDLAKTSVDVTAQPVQLDLELSKV